jgi:hypothetical protein
MRNVSQSISDWPKVLSEVYLCTAPGGYVELAESGCTCHTLSLAIGYTLLTINATPSRYPLRRPHDGHGRFLQSQRRPSNQSA